MTSLRILIFNAGYMAGITDLSVREYASKSHRFALPSTKTRSRVADDLARMLSEQRPDVAFISEIHDSQHLTPLKEIFPTTHVDSKYAPTHILNWLPFFWGNRNGLFLAQPHAVRKTFLSHGTKTLLYQVDIQERVSLFFAHLALRKHLRKKQLQEIGEIIRKLPAGRHAVVAGDFNSFGGLSELDDVAKETGLRVVNPVDKHTFPSARPISTIDLFMTSPGIKVNDIRILDDVVLSDHLPVVLDMEIV